MASAKSGRRVGHYQLQTRLGSGGFGTVWAALDERTGGEVAIKVLHPKFLARTNPGGPSIADRFISEATLLKRLEHPNIVRILDIVDQRDEDLIAYVMERLQGRDLEDLEAEVPLALVLEVMAQAADTLQVVHGHDIIHRDIKLANIFVCDPLAGRPRERPVKLIDFGVAKDLAEASMMAETAAGVFVGTLEYMAPECFARLRDPQVQLTPAVDQWGLGVALYQALSGGELPFRAGGGPGVALLIESDEPTPLRMAHRFGYRSLPPQLDQIWRRCLAKDPAARFEDLAAVAEALRAANEAVTDTSDANVVASLLEDLPTSARRAAAPRAKTPLWKEGDELETLRDRPLPFEDDAQDTLRGGVAPPADDRAPAPESLPTLRNQVIALRSEVQRGDRPSAEAAPRKPPAPPAPPPTPAPARGPVPLPLMLALLVAGAALAFVFGWMLAG